MGKRYARPKIGRMPEISADYGLHLGCPPGLVGQAVGVVVGVEVESAGWFMAAIVGWGVSVQ
jgi:hypothetical protein